ncbi:MAG: heavy metal translocating P-type ATPase [Steroidobacteraceae bacterium]|nr:heavy metal translocating P-type ATPase [Steroidobacteraceae bacterium]
MTRSPAPPASATAHADGCGCFHCGEPIPVGVRMHVEVDGTARAVCCIGCRAAAELIRDAGLGDYYRWRAAPAPRPEAADDVWSSYDRPEVQAPLVGREGPLAVVNVLVEGLRCAACSWLIDHRLAQVRGLVRASLNPATARAQLAWDPLQVSLGTLLREIAALGYRPHVLGQADTLEVATRERRTALKRLAVAGFGMMQIMMVAYALWLAPTQGMDPVIREYLRFTCLLVTTPVAFYAGWPFFAGAIASLRARHVGMDVPVAIGIGLAYAMSAWNTFTGQGEVYYDSVTMFVFLLLAGRYVEMLARHRAGSTTEALVRLVPAMALKVTPAGRERVACTELRDGDRVVVPLGESFPADGRIVAGATQADESLLTGESQPVAKAAGARVIAGSTNVGGPVEVEVDAVGQATVLAGIVRLLERAQTERPRLARLADRWATWFVVRVLGGAALVCAAWLVVDPSRAFEATLAVLVVTCPCALSLATPTAITAATAFLARRGLLVTRADALETLAGATHAVFDKTGTLTLGRPRLTKVHALDGDVDAALAAAAALERASEHPLARAFDDVPTSPATAVRVEPGRGVEGEVNGERLRIGTAGFVAELTGPVPQALAQAAVVLGGVRGWRAAFEFGDAPRPGAAAAVAGLRARGLGTTIASGDHARQVAGTATVLGIDDWHARLLPEDKLALVQRLRTAGARVLAVGDGVNDAPTLRAADVAVALGTGSALAQASADLVALRGDLATLPEAVDVARRTVAIVRQNLAWSAAYNVIALPFAALGYVPPWLAAIGMSLSSLFVVLNALRLARAPASTSTVPAAVPLPRAMEAA